MGSGRRTAQQREDAERERIAKIEVQLAQRKNLLQQLAARRLSAERQIARRERARRLLTVGGVAELAGIAGLDRDALLGGFLELADRITDGATLELWRAVGAVVHAEQAGRNIKSAAAQGISTTK